MSRPTGTVVVVIDLHMHSTVSDGTDGPGELARLVVAAGLSAASLTDHDSIGGHAAFAEVLAGSGVEFVPGCEISCLHAPSGLSAHVLCYFLGPDTSPLHETLAVLRTDRATRNTQLLERLGELGFDQVSAEEIEDRAGKPLVEAGRPHFAESVLASYPGRFATVNEVFSRLLARGQPAYIPKAHVTVGQASCEAAASGAVAVIAHPIITFCPLRDGVPWPIDEQREHLDEIFAGLAADGVVGAEAYYSRHSPEQIAMVVELCERHDLVPTGGSDYHGSIKPDLGVGVGIVANKGTSSELRVPDSALAALKARRPQSTAR